MCVSGPRPWNLAVLWLYGKALPFPCVQPSEQSRNALYSRSSTKSAPHRRWCSQPVKYSKRRYPDRGGIRPGELRPRPAAPIWRLLCAGSRKQWSREHPQPGSPRRCRDGSLRSLADKRGTSLFVVGLWGSVAAGSGADAVSVGACVAVEMGLAVSAGACVAVEIGIAVSAVDRGQGWRRRFG